MVRASELTYEGWVARVPSIAAEIRRVLITALQKGVVFIPAIAGCWVHYLGEDGSLMAAQRHNGNDYSNPACQKAMNFAKFDQALLLDGPNVDVHDWCWGVGDFRKWFEEIALDLATVCDTYQLTELASDAMKVQTFTHGKSCESRVNDSSWMEIRLRYG